MIATVFTRTAKPPFLHLFTSDQWFDERKYLSQADMTEVNLKFVLDTDRQRDR